MSGLHLRRLATLLALLCQAAGSAHAVELEPLSADQPPISVEAVTYNPFEDIPREHPAYEDIDRLVQAGILEGFPDGTFRGQRVITRYDLALALARAHSRIQAQAAQGPPVSPEEAQLIDRLSREVGTELSFLGVRTNSLEERIQRTERRQDEFIERKSNINILGFYRLEQSVVVEPFSFGEYPFIQDFFPFLDYTDRGLVPLKQEAFLRFTGHPTFFGVPAQNVEAFGELRAQLIGNAGLFVNHEFSRPGFPGDRVDDEATSVEDEARVFFNRAHFNLKTKNLFFRAFSNESASDLNDPDVLFTVDSFSPFSGVEASGGIGKLSYFSSALKRQTVEGFSGVDPRDIRRFTPDVIVDQDAFTMRMMYEPYKGSQTFTDRRLVLGSTFVEVVDDYHTLDSKNRVVGIDAHYSIDQNESHWDATTSYLRSAGFDNIEDDAVKFDGSYSNDGWLMTTKFYRFGPHFRAEAAQNQFIDTDVSFNFHRSVTPDLLLPLAKGENLFRLQLRHDWEGNIDLVENLVMQTVYETKSWTQDPLNPVINDEENGHRWYLQTIADVTRRLRMEHLIEFVEDIRIDHITPGVLDPNEIGTLANTIRADWSIMDNLSLFTEFEFREDPDSIDGSGNEFDSFRHKEEIAWQAHPRFFIKAANEQVTNSELQINGLPFFPVNERALFRKIFEFTWIPLEKLAIKSLIVSQKTQNNLLRAAARRGGTINLEDNGTTIWVWEALANFTPALKLRYVYQYQDTSLVNIGVSPLFLNNLNISNNFLDVSYNPTAATEVRLTFGTEYENPNDPLDNGPAKFFKTAKVVQLRAQTNF